MEIQKKKSARILLPITQDLKDKVYSKADQIDCSVTALITSMIEHCFAEMENPK